MFPMTLDPTRTDVRVRVGWAIGELAVATFVGLTMIYMLFFLTQALRVPPMLAGLALLIPRLWDVFIDPLIGTASDRTRSRLGRRRPFLLAGGLTFGSLFALIFFVDESAATSTKFLYVTALYILSSTAYSIFDVPYSAMAAEITTDYRGRTELTGYKMIAARLGIVASVTVGPLLFTSQTTLAGGFRLLGIVSGAFMTVTCLIAFWATAHAPRIERPVVRFNAREELQAVVSNRPFRILWLVFLLQNLAIGASATTLVYLITIVMRADAKIVGPLIATSAVVALLATPFWVQVSKRTGKRKGYFYGIALTAVMSLPALFIQPAFYPILFVTLALTGLGDAAIQLFPNSMVPDTVEVDELLTGQRREGAIFGAWSFCRKLGMAAGAFLVSAGLSSVGFVSGAGAVQTADAIQGIRILYCVVPLLLWLGAFLMLRFYDLTESRFESIKSQLAERH